MRMMKITSPFRPLRSPTMCNWRSVPPRLKDAGKCKPPYEFSTHIGAACAKQFRTFADLSKKPKMDVTDLMRQCNGKAPQPEQACRLRSRHPLLSGCPARPNRNAFSLLP